MYSIRRKNGKVILYKGDTGCFRVVDEQAVQFVAVPRLEPRFVAPGL